MTFEEYQELYKRTRNPNLSWFDEMGNAGMGLAGEAGEVCDLLKKILYHEHEVDRDKLVDELGDLMWYLALTIDAINTALDSKKASPLTLDEILDRNIDKLRHRYPDGFDRARSFHRTFKENVDESVD